MNDDKMLQPMQGQELPAQMVEQLYGVLGQVEQLMRSMASALSATNQRMERLERQVQQLTPLTGAQEKAIGKQIRQRAEELQEEYKLPASCVPKIASAIRKEIKLTGGVQAIRELPRIEYAVYMERISLWDDYSVMKIIRKGIKMQA